MKPLGLFWWNDEPNFGDTLSREVTRYVSGREVEWASAQACDLFGVGSILTFARRAHNNGPRAGGTPWVWGSGCIGPMRVDFVKNVRFASLRGPLSASILKLKVPSYGDAGLLAPEALGDKPRKTQKIGLVIHHKILDKFWRDDMVPDVKGAKVIDVRNPDHMAVIREIASCKLVVSSSLHGLIVADAFGIPSIWLNPEGNHGSSRFKFYDYANSIGRPMRHPVDVADLKAAIEAHDLGPLDYAHGIEATRQDILAAFPEELKA